MKTFLFDLDGTLLAANESDFMRAYFDELVRALHGLLPAEGLARNILAATARMQADISSGSNNMEKFRRDLRPCIKASTNRPFGIASWSSMRRPSTTSTTS